MQQSSGTKVWMSREGHRDTLKTCVVPCENVRDTGTSLMLERELEHVRRELRNLKTGQHEHTDGTLKEKR